ncbi:MAG: recombinase family protein [Defluviitaleaceae bacterium]|nr:recombinase family protein [Defluviitaleaceae bacterium]
MAKTKTTTKQPSTQSSPTPTPISTTPTPPIIPPPQPKVNPQNFQKEENMKNNFRTSNTNSGHATPRTSSTKIPSTKHPSTKHPSTKITALYARLSVGDERHGNNGNSNVGNITEDSNSIINQKLQLEAYAKQNNFLHTRHYTDDDESGRFFDRSGYSQMMADVESGKIGVVIMKDLTRWGRDHVQVGIAMETFRQNGVRFIAINNGIDSINPESLEFAPFINIMSEWYAKDTSKKIKSAFKSKGTSGKRIGSMPPYGYIKCQNDKNLLLIDEPSAEVVRRIFQLTLAGKGPYQICTILSNDKVPIPAYYQSQQGYGLWKNREIKDPYAWNSSTITSIIAKHEYCGDTVNFKTRKHLKDKKSHYVDESEWMFFEGTHEAIIDRITFENAQRIRKNNQRRRPNGWGYVHPLSGLLFCSDCGGKLYIHRLYNGKNRPTAVCGNYARGSDKTDRKWAIVCKSGHRIEAAIVMELVGDTLRGIAEFAKSNKQLFRKAVQELLTSQQTDEVKKQKKRLAQCNKRFLELEKLLNKIYEDNALGNLPQKRYESLLQTYGQEQDDLDKEINQLQTTVERYEGGSAKANNFIKLVESYVDFEEITTTMLHEFVNKIVVHERERKGAINSPQTVEIHLNFIGQFIPPSMALQRQVQSNLTPEELAEQEKLQQRRNRARKSYEKRVANGKQKEYYDRWKERKQAEYKANREVLFDKDYVLGADIMSGFRGGVGK